MVISAYIGKSQIKSIHMKRDGERSKLMLMLLVSQRLTQDNLTIDTSNLWKSIAFIPKREHTTEFYN